MWGTGHLTEAAQSWTHTATVWEDCFTQLTTRIGFPGGTAWEGAAADAAFARAHGDRMIVIGLADELHVAARIARTGAGEIAEARRAVLRVVESAENAGFSVGEDFSVTCPGRFDPVTAAARQAQAIAIATELRATVGALVTTDQRVAASLTSATAGLGTTVFPESVNEASMAVQLVDYRNFKEAPIPEPGTPDDPAAGRAPNPIYPGRDTSGRFVPGNTGSVDGAAAAEQRLQKFETQNDTTLIRQQVRAAVIDPATGQPMTDPQTGKPLFRYYDALAPTGTPGQYVGIEVKSGSADLTRSQRVFDSRVSAQTPAVGTLNGQPVRIIDTELLNAPRYVPNEGPARPALDPVPEPPVRGLGPRFGGVMPDDAMPRFVDIPGHIAGAPDVPVLGDGIPDHDR